MPWPKSSCRNRPRALRPRDPRQEDRGPRQPSARPCASWSRKCASSTSRWTTRYAEWQNAPPTRPKQDKLPASSRSSTKSSRRTFPKFYYKQKVIEEMALVADNIHDKIQLSLRSIHELDSRNASPPSSRPSSSPKSARSKPWRSSCACPTQNYLERLQAAAALHCAKPCRPRPRWSKPTCAWSFPSPRNTPTAACPSST